MTAPSPANGFFIVGTGRSGTTMFRNLLRYHSDVYLPRETHWIPFLYDTFGMQQVPHDEFFRIMNSFYMAKGTTPLERILKESGIDPELFETRLRDRLSDEGKDTIADFYSQFYAVLADHHGAKVWGDKTPDYGMCMGLLQQLWPNARFVHIARDGRDVALSMSKVRSFRLQVAWEVNYWWAIAWKKLYKRRLKEIEGELPLEKFFELWKSRTLRTRDESQRLKPGTYLEIDYDGLLTEPRTVLSRVGEFLEFPGDESWIDEAAQLINADNTGKNRLRPEYQELTRQYSDVLKDMGFEPQETT